MNLFTKQKQTHRHRKQTYGYQRGKVGRDKLGVWDQQVQNTIYRDFSGGPVVETLPATAGSVGSIPSWGAKIPHALWPKNQTIKQKQYCNKFNKDFKNGPHQKNL